MHFREQPHASSCFKGDGPATSIETNFVKFDFRRDACMEVVAKTTNQKQKKSNKPLPDDGGELLFVLLLRLGGIRKLS